MNDQSGIPKWMVARAVIWGQIEEGTLVPGQKLPPEPELAALVGVSRATLREALRSLEEDGYLQRKPGAGTHVARGPRLASNLNSNSGVADIIRSMGLVPGTQSLKIQVSNANEEVRRSLELDVDTKVAVIERVRTADQIPMVFSTSFYPIPTGGSLSQEFNDLGGESLYSILDRLAGIRVAYGTGTLSPAQADRRLATELEVPVGTLLMHLRQIDYDIKGSRVMLSSEYYVSDAFEFTVLRKGSRVEGKLPLENDA